MSAPGLGAQVSPPGLHLAVFYIQHLRTEETCQVNTKLTHTLQDCYPGLTEVYNSQGCVFSKRVKSSTFRKQELQIVNEGSPAIILDE